MKILGRMIVTVVVLGALSVPAIAQDASLRMLPEDTAIVIEVNLKSLFSILPADVVNEMREQSLKEMGVDLFGSTSSIIAGVPAGAMTGGNEVMYMLFRGSLTVDTLINAAKAKGEKVVQKQIGSLTAYSTKDDEDDDDMMAFVASAGPGMLVFGSPTGLEMYQKVVSGQMKNASGNGELIAAGQDLLPNSIMSVYGVMPAEVKASGPPQLSDVNSLAFAANYVSNFLNIRLVFNAGTEATLQNLDMMISQYSQMSAQMDSTGTFSELVENLKTNISGTKMTITTGMSKAGIEKLAQQIKSMAAMAGGFDEDYDDEDDEY